MDLAVMTEARDEERTTWRGQRDRLATAGATLKAEMARLEAKPIASAQRRSRQRSRSIVGDFACWHL